MFFPLTKERLFCLLLLLWVSSFHLEPAWGGLSSRLPLEGSKVKLLQFTHEEEAAAVGVWGGGRIGTAWRAQDRKEECKKKKKKFLIKVTSCHASSVWQKGRAWAALQSVLHHAAAALRSGTKHSEGTTLLARPFFFFFFNGSIRVCSGSGWALFPLGLQVTGAGLQAFFFVVVARST